MVMWTKTKSESHRSVGRKDHSQYKCESCSQALTLLRYICVRISSDAQSGDSGSYAKAIALSNSISKQAI